MRLVARTAVCLVALVLVCAAQEMSGELELFADKGCQNKVAGVPMFSCTQSKIQASGSEYGSASLYSNGEGGFVFLAFTDTACKDSRPYQLAAGHQGTKYSLDIVWGDSKVACVRYTG